MTTATPPAAGPVVSAAEVDMMIRVLALRQLAVQSRVRHWRNVTASLCGVLVVALPVFALVAPEIGSGLVRIRVDGPAAHATSSTFTAGDLLAVELWGALGGIVGVISAVGNISISAVNVSLQVTQLVLKPLAGAAFAIFGVIAIQGGLFTQFQPLTTASIAAYAALFGFAQQLLTRMIDRRANSLLGTATPAGAANQGVA